MRNRSVFLMWLAIGVAPLACATAQVTGSSPNITITSWQVTRFGRTQVVPINQLATFQHMERDIIRVSFLVVDPDWIVPITVDPTTGEVDNQNEPVFLRYELAPLFDFPPQSPSPPPIEFLLNGVWIPEDEGFRPLPGPTTPYTLTPDPFVFQIPDISGRNQRRLLGLQNYDVRYLARFCVANDPDNDPEPRFIGCTNLPPIIVIENPAFRPGTPNVLADAGADQTVARGATVQLDGSRTFSSYNVGFDPANPFVIEQTPIEFAWEWVSGPVRADPVQPGLATPEATVQLTVSGLYEFRLTTDSPEVAGPPSSDVVTITVLDALPPQTAPTAVIIGPANAVIVGQTVTLNGSTSSDPEGDPLTFRWRQTNALGQQLTGDQLLDGFQALSGVDTHTSTWQATAPGTYYFRLLVSDGTFVSVATFTVRVIENSTSGANEIAESPETDASLTDTSVQVAPVGVCGAGLAPMSLLPLALLALRRRR